MARRGNPNAVKIGAGLLYAVAPGHAEPTNNTDSFTATQYGGWTALGYTSEGSRFTRSIDVTGVEVAEELNNIRNAITGLTEELEFSLAQTTALNLSIAINGGGQLDSPDAAGNTTVVAPPLGAERRIAIGWRSFDSQETMVFRNCLSTGDVVLERSKSDKTLIPVTFSLEQPVIVPSTRLGTSDGTETWVHYFDKAVNGFAAS